jgi:hypothetical protein
MDDLWVARDLPVLRYLVEELDSLGHRRPTPEDASEATGLDVDDTRRAFRNLARADPAYVVGIEAAGAAYPLQVHTVTERAYRAVGAWPTADRLATDIAAAF